MLFGCEGSDAALKSACAYILLPPYPGLLYLALFYLFPCPLAPPLCDDHWLSGPRSKQGL